MFDYKLQYLLKIKFKNDLSYNQLNFKDENIEFLLNCYNRFLNQSCNDSYLKYEDRFKKIKKTHGIKFELKQIEEKIKEFTFKYVKNKITIFSLTGFVDSGIFKIEESYKEGFYSFPGVSISNLDFISNKINKDLKVFSEYSDKSLKFSDLNYKNFTCNGKNYVLFNKRDFFDVRYFYKLNEEDSYTYEKIVYFREFKKFRFMVRKYNDRIVAENKISETLISYTNDLNKDIADIQEQDISNVIILNY